MDLRNECVRVLRQNWREGYTVPSPHLYPFQWNWDSGFIALGHLHFEPEMALQEMESLFKGQWDNGFLPHIIFHNEAKYGRNYFPSADYWNSRVSEYAPKHLKTTGITQPPIHGYVLERIHQQLGNSDRLAKLLDKVLLYHRNLYEQRDALDNGLVAVWHNWETGMDNSPWWDVAIDRIHAEQLGSIRLNRKDIKAVDNYEETRPSDDEYRRYLWLLETLQSKEYASCPSDFPFQLLDLTVNSLLLVSTESLIRLGADLGRDTSWLEQKVMTGKASFNQLLWSERDGNYYPYDRVSEQQVPLLGAAGFLPLFAGIPSENQAMVLVKKLETYRDLYGVPSFDPSHPKFEPKRYWRGPIWVNMSYMIWKGLLRYDFTEQANHLKETTVEMVERYGLREYYPVDKQETTAYGGTDFSWSASLVLDMLNS